MSLGKTEAMAPKPFNLQILEGRARSLSLVASKYG